MKYTNKYGLSPEIVRAITKERYIVEDEAPSDYSISDLINPVQMTTIKKNYPDDLVVRDVVDLFYSFMGSVAHQVLEDAAHEDDLTTVEERLYMKVGDVTISGKLDCYQHEANIIEVDGKEVIVPYEPSIVANRRPPQIRDYKTTKVYNIQKGDHKKWEEQENCYAILLTENNKPVEDLTITCLIFDWKENDIYKQNYPRTPIIDLQMPLWSTEKQRAYIEEKVEELLYAKELDLKELSRMYPCSQKDMWQEHKGFSVIKKGSTTASRNVDTYEEGLQYIENSKSATLKSHEIKERVGSRRRCFRFCDAAKMCEQHKRMCKEEGVPHTYPNHDLNIEPLF